MAAGDAKSDLWWTIGIFVGLGVLWAITGGPETYGVPQGPFIPSPLSPAGRSTFSAGAEYRSAAESPRFAGDTRALGEVPVGERSPWYGQVTIGRGNAAGADLAQEEYIVLSASRNNKLPVAISGWRLRNGRDQKLATQGSKEGYYRAITAEIPTGTAVFSPTGDHIKGPIVLNPGDRAYVVTGSGLSSRPYPMVTSFRLNKCFGYIVDLDRYDFYPSVPRSCPNPEDEAGVGQLAESCYRFISRLPSCRTPEFYDYGDYKGTVDRVKLSTNCERFVRDHYSYPACVRWHASDPDFLRPEWRIYLNQVWEMWDRSQEVITLFDAQGKIVDRLAY